MKILLIIIYCLIIDGTDAVTIVTGYRGRSVQIQCHYDPGYEKHTKYLCRGKCSVWQLKDIPIDSRSDKDSRFSLYDNTTARVFTITITDLRPEDENTYWCSIERTGFDIYTEIQMLVKTDDPVNMTVLHTTHSSQTHILNRSVHAETTHSTTANPLSGANHSTITHNILGVSEYAMISTGAVLVAVGVIIAIYWKIKHQGSVTVIQSSRETNGDEENDQSVLPLQAREKNNLLESVYGNLDPATDQPESVYQNMTFTNNQSDSVYQDMTFPNKQ